MKPLVVFVLITSYLLFAPFAYAQGTVENTIGTVTPPGPISNIVGGTGEEKLGTLLSTIIRVLYAVAIISFVFMFIWAAIQWIVSGGDKEALAGARKRMVNALIGLVILALAFVIFTIIGRITGLSLYKGQASQDPAKLPRQNTNF